MRRVAFVLLAVVAGASHALAQSPPGSGRGGGSARHLTGPEITALLRGRTLYSVPPPGQRQNDSQESYYAPDGRVYGISSLGRSMVLRYGIEGNQLCFLNSQGQHAQPRNCVQVRVLGGDRYAFNLHGTDVGIVTRAAAGDPERVAARVAELMRRQRRGLGDILADDLDNQRADDARACFARNGRQSRYCNDYDDLR